MTATEPEKLGVDNDTGYQVYSIPLDDIFLDESFNCRGSIAPIDVLDLARDIKDRKLDTPITVQPYDGVPGKKYRIVTGHRRYTAFEVNRADPEVGEKYSEIPAFIERNLDETQARTLNLRENLHRKQLNILQEANSLKYYFDLKVFSDIDIADMVGMSPPWVTVRKALLKLPKEIQEVAAAGLMTQQQIKHCATLKTPEKQFAFVKKIKEAKEKGESLNLTPSIKTSKDALKQRERKAPEIKEMKELIYDTFGPNLATRALAWAEGVISTVELNGSIEAEARKLGIQYKTPDWINRALVGDKSKDDDE